MKTQNAAPINERIFRAIMDTCMIVVEESAEAAELIERHNKAVKTVQGKVDLETFHYFENALWETAAIFGNEMFRQGVELGRNPAMVFDLPDVDNALGD